MICLLSNDGIKIRILGTWVYYLVIFQESIGESELIEQNTNYIYFYNYLDLYGLEFVWTWFKIDDSDVFYFILFEFMIKYLFFK